jgi:predicted nucleic acid-binding protein
VYYLDTSAATKLVVAERGSTSLRRWLSSQDGRVFSSDLLRTELLRATRRVAPGQMTQARAVLDSVLMLRLTTPICERAAMLEPSMMRSLDAMHLSAALEMGDDLEGLVTYDDRLANGAEAIGIPVVGPR